MLVACARDQVSHFLPSASLVDFFHARRALVVARATMFFAYPVATIGVNAQELALAETGAPAEIMTAAAAASNIGLNM